MAIVCNEDADPSIRAALIAQGALPGALAGGRLCVVGKQQIDLREVERDRYEERVRMSPAFE